MSGAAQPVIVPNALVPLLEEADRRTGPVDEMSLAAKLSAAIPIWDALSKDERRGAFAEIEALRFQRPLHEPVGPWGIYWGALSSVGYEDGRQVFSPDAAYADEGIITHWLDRSANARHPALRAKFADLAWEIGRWRRNEIRKAGTAWSLEIPHNLAQRAIDACIETVTKGMCQDEFHCWQMLERAVQLACSLKDEARIRQSKSALFEYHRNLKQAEPKFQWWRFDDITWEYGKSLSLTDEDKQEVVATLEDALTRHADHSKGDVFDPHQAMTAVDRLSRRWAEAEDLSKLRTALRTAALAFESAAKGADGMLATAWLEDLIPRYRRVGMIEDATRVEQAIRERAEEAQAQMKRIEVPYEVPKEELDKWVDAVAGESAEDAYRKIAAHFLIREKDTKQSLQEMLKNAPMSALMPISIVGPGGFTAATIGSINDDLDGRAIHHAADLFNWHAAWLYMALNRAKDKHSFGAAIVLAQLSQAPQFAPQREALLRDGLAAWEAEDPVKAIHVLVPQLEAALRDLAATLGDSVVEYRQETGGFEVIGMGKTLHRQRFRAVVPSDVRFHLRVFYTDARGINLRNRLAHGLLHSGLLGMGVANWVVHSLMVVGMLRLVRGPEEGSK